MTLIYKSVPVKFIKKYIFIKIVWRWVTILYDKTVPKSLCLLYERKYVIRHAVFDFVGISALFVVEQSC